MTIIDRARDALNNATPGPWFYDGTEAPDGRFIAVQKLKAFTRLTLNDAALKDFIEDCAYYIECVGGDGEHGMAASARAALRQLIKQGFGDQVVEFTRGYQINF